MDFYATAAQVIPLLLLALAFEARGEFVPALTERQVRAFRDLRASRSKRTDEEILADLAPTLTEMGFDGDDIVGDPDTLTAIFDAADNHFAKRDRAAAHFLAGVLSIITLAILVGGEALALGALASDHKTTFTLTTIALSMLLGGVLIVYPLVLTQIRRAIGAEHQDAAVGTAVILVLLIAIGAVFNFVLSAHV
jgi:hypothetical protein